VFTGTVRNIIEPVQSPPSPSSGIPQGRQVANNSAHPPPQKRIIRFELEEAFIGVPYGLAEVQIVTGLGGGDCGYDFQRGVDYIVYAFKNAEGQLETGICSRTRLLRDAEEDLAYLRAIASAPPTGEIRIVRVSSEVPGMAGIRTRVEGRGQEHFLLTDTAGEATLRDLIPGQYRVRAELDGYLPVDRTVEVSAKGCVEVPIFMSPDRRIQGRVITSSGLPAANIDVEVRPVQEMSGDSVKTDTEGRYELRRFRAGGYYLGINLQQPPTPESPYTRWFYPGTEDLARATVIYFSEEVEMKSYDLMLPERQNERVVEGAVFWPDGRPVAGARMFVLDARWLWHDFVARATTDANGRFSLPRLLDGTHYRLHAVFLNTSPYGMNSAEPINIQPGKTPLKLRLVLTRTDNSVTEDQRRGVEQFRDKQ
jgi:hypothetical protein